MTFTRRRFRPRVLPPLSLSLRDLASRSSGTHCSFGESRQARLLSSVHQPFAVLLPERFRGGCAFGSESENPVSPARVAATLLDRTAQVNAGKHRPCGWSAGRRFNGQGDSAVLAKG